MKYVLALISTLLIGAFAESADIIIAISNKPMSSLSECQEYYKEDPFIFAMNWGDDNKVYWCAYHSENHEWPEEKHTISFYEPNKASTIMSMEYNKPGMVIYGSSELRDIFQKNRNLDANFETADYIVSVEQESVGEVATTTFQIRRPFSKVYNLQFLPYSVDSYEDLSLSNINYGDIIDTYETIDMSQYNNVIYICAQFKWNLIGGDIYVEVGYQDDSEQWVSIKEVERNDVPETQPTDFKCLEVNSDELLGRTDFIARAAIVNDNIAVGNDDISEEFSIL